jgi:Skp family chaperone for outer membrane proteins
MRNRIIALGVLSVLVAVVAAPAQDGQGPLVLAIDLERVVRDCDETRDALAKLQAMQEQKKKEFADKVAELEGRKKQLLEKTALSERDEKWYTEFLAVAKEASEIRATEALFSVQANDQVARKMDQLMKGAREAAEEIRRKRGAVMVIISKLGPIKSESEKQVELDQVFRRVLCCDKEADITDDVLDAMNAWYKQNRREDGTVAPRKEDPAAAKETPAPAGDAPAPPEDE